MKKALISTVFIGFMVIIVLFARSPQAKVLHAELGGEALLLVVADTDILRKQGLSGHRPLALNEGMLFVFPADDKHSFWMKDMLFPIDIFWLDNEYRIVDVKERATPESYPEVFTSSVPARYVLELSEGFFSSHKLKLGDGLKILR